MHQAGQRIWAGKQAFWAGVAWRQRVGLLGLGV